MRQGVGRLDDVLSAIVQPDAVFFSAVIQLFKTLLTRCKAPLIAPRLGLFRHDAISDLLRAEVDNSLCRWQTPVQHLEKPAEACLWIAPPHAHALERLRLLDGQYCAASCLSVCEQAVAVGHRRPQPFLPQVRVAHRLRVDYRLGLVFALLSYGISISVHMR